MKIRISELKQIIREELRSPASPGFLNVTDAGACEICGEGNSPDRPLYYIDGVACHGGTCSAMMSHMDRFGDDY